MKLRSWWYHVHFIVKETEALEVFHNLQRITADQQEEMQLKNMSSDSRAMLFNLELCNLAV